VGWARRGLFCLFIAAAFGAAPATRPGLPDRAALDKAEEAVRGAYGKDLVAITPGERQRVARRLLKEAEETRDDPALRYALLRNARDIAAIAGDAGLALRAVDLMAGGYAIDGLAEKVKVLGEMGRAARADLGPAADEALARACLAVIDDAVRDDRFEAAERLCGVASAAAERTRRTTVVALAQERVKEFKALSQERAAVRAAAAVLKSRPDDADCCLKVGRFACFVKGDWDAGLKLLAAGSDAVLAAIAKEEIAGNADANGQMKVGDGWWALAGREAGLVKQRMMERAAAWYARSLPTLTGARRKIVEDRVRQVEGERLRAMQLEPGLIAEIFDGQEKFDRLLATRTDGQVYFDWGKGAVGPGLPKDHFSVRWSGYLRIEKARRYVFRFVANRGCRLFVDDRLVFEGPVLTPVRNGQTKAVDLTEGMHGVRLEYWEDTGEAKMQWIWEPPAGGGEEPVPASVLFHDWRGEVK